MHILNRDAHSIKRFLHLNKGIVVPFNKLGVHSELKIEMLLVHKYLKTLTSRNYVTKYGNWQHAWYFVTEEGDKKLREEVGLPSECRDAEALEIKN